MEDHDMGLDEGIPTTTTITLVSNDNVSFAVDNKVCNNSLYLQGIIDLDSEVETINIDTTGELLKLIVEFLEFYSNNKDSHFHRIQKPVPNNFEECKFIHDKKDDIFDVPFCTTLLTKLDNDSLMYLILIVNYLGISPLLELCCAKMSYNIRGKSKEEVKQILKINNTTYINEEEYIEMKTTNDWINE